MQPEDFDIKAEHIHKLQWNLAIRYLQQVENVITPEEKLSCYERACDIISGSVRGVTTEQDPDEVSVLIYLIIKASPTRMHTTLKYSSLIS